MARASPRKRRVVNYNEDQHDDKPTAKRAAAKAVAKVKEVIAEEIEEVKGVVAKVTGKRKAEPEVETKAIAAPKVVKKRKTKGKEEDSMPLASRTAVSSLKSAMHIGAHVSAAGGLSHLAIPERNPEITSFV